MVDTTDERLAEAQHLFNVSTKPNYAACTNLDMPSKWIAAIYDDALNCVPESPLTSFLAVIGSGSVDSRKS